MGIREIGFELKLNYSRNLFAIYSYSSLAGNVNLSDIACLNWSNLQANLCSIHTTNIEKCFGIEIEYLWL